MAEKSIGIPFISFHDRKGFVLNPEAEEYLRSVGDTKIGVVSVVGKYRTGKSFFINRVLLNKTQVFKVGPTINPCTKGLWLWKDSIKSENPDYKNMEVLVIDTEGFGGIDEGINHDMRIFLFSLLLSSYFIYNSVGNIDEATINSLSLIVNLAKDIQIKMSHKNQEKNEEIFPTFLWLIRDFALKMIDQNGKAISPKEYMEKSLENQKGVSDSVESKNRIRRMIKHFFHERDCSTLIRPVEEEQLLQKIDELEDIDLRPEFLQQKEAIRKKILMKVKPKTMFGKSITANMFIEICKSYIEAINKGAVPVIENTWNYVVKQSAEKECNVLIEKLKKETQNFDFENQNFNDFIKSQKKAIIKLFKEQVQKQGELDLDYEEYLVQRINQEFQQTKEHLSEKAKVNLIKSKDMSSITNNYLKM